VHVAAAPYRATRTSIHYSFSCVYTVYTYTVRFLSFAVSKGRRTRATYDGLHYTTVFLLFNSSKIIIRCNTTHYITPIIYTHPLLPRRIPDFVQQQQLHSWTRRGRTAGEKCYYSEMHHYAARARIPGVMHTQIHINEKKKIVFNHPLILRTSSKTASSSFPFHLFHYTKYIILPLPSRLRNQPLVRRTSAGETIALAIRPFFSFLYSAPSADAFLIHAAVRCSRKSK
jgi:hypothetical protein